MVGMKPSYRCRSEPQIAVDVILTIASCGLRIFGSGTCSTRTSLCSIPTICFHKFVPNLDYYRVLTPVSDLRVFRLSSVRNRRRAARYCGWACRLPLCRGNLAGLHHLLKAMQIRVDLLVGSLVEELRDHVAESASQRIVHISTLTTVPRPAGAGSKRTEPLLSTSAPGNERHAIRSFGWSSVISASHSAALPAGAFASQWECLSAVVRTDLRCDMKFGRFSKFRQY